VNTEKTGVFEQLSYMMDNGYHQIQWYGYSKPINKV